MSNPEQEIQEPKIKFTCSFYSHSEIIIQREGMRNTKEFPSPSMSFFSFVQERW